MRYIAKYVQPTLLIMSHTGSTPHITFEDLDFATDSKIQSAFLYYMLYNICYIICYIACTIDYTLITMHYVGVSTKGYTLLQPYFYNARYYDVL